MLYIIYYILYIIYYILYHIILYYIILYYFILYYIILYYIILYYIDPIKMKYHAHHTESMALQIRVNGIKRPTITTSREFWIFGHWSPGVFVSIAPELLPPFLLWILSRLFFSFGQTHHSHCRLRALPSFQCLADRWSLRHMSALIAVFSKRNYCQDLQSTSDWDSDAGTEAIRKWPNMLLEHIVH